MKTFSGDAYRGLRKKEWAWVRRRRIDEVEGVGCSSRNFKMRQQKYSSIEFSC